MAKLETNIPEALEGLHQAQQFVNLTLIRGLAAAGVVDDVAVIALLRDYASSDLCGGVASEVLKALADTLENARARSEALGEADSAPQLSFTLIPGGRKD